MDARISGSLKASSHDLWAVYLNLRSGQWRTPSIQADAHSCPFLIERAYRRMLTIDQSSLARRAQGFSLTILRTVKRTLQTGHLAAVAGMTVPQLGHLMSGSIETDRMYRI
jgi:hypothetical protein